MRKTRDTGAFCSGKDAGGMMRRGMIAVAVLLLACTLMAGAVSGTTDYGSVLLEITTSYTLPSDIDAGGGNNKTLILINANDVTLDGGGHQLIGNGNTTYGIRIADGCSNITLTNFANITNISGPGTYVYGVYAGKWGSNLTISNLTFGDIISSGPNLDAYGLCIDSVSGTGKSINISECTFSGSINGRSTYGISIKGLISELEIENCQFTGSLKTSQQDKGSSRAIDVNAGASGSTSTMTIRNCTVSGSIHGYKAYGIWEEWKGWYSNDLYPENAAIIIQNCEITGTITGSSATGSSAYGIIPKGATVTVDNVTVNIPASESAWPLLLWPNATTNIQTTNIQVTNSTFSINGGPVVRCGALDPSRFTLTFTGNTIGGTSGAVFEDATTYQRIYAGDIIFTGNSYNPDLNLFNHSGGNANISGVNWTLDLTPGNKTIIGGNPYVDWGGDATQGYNLSLSGAANYILTDNFTTTGTGIEITADGVTLDGNGKQITGNGQILKVNTSSGGTTGVTLNNLNITAASGATGNPGLLTLQNKTILKNSILNISGITPSGTGMVSGVYVLGETATGTRLTGNTITGGGNQGSGPACVVVINGADDVLVKDNTLTMGTAADGTNLMESYGVQIKTADTKNATVINNTIRAGERGKANYKGIDIITVGDYGNHTITGNTFALYKVENDSVIQITAGSDTRPEGGSLNLTVTGNTFAPGSGAGYGIYAKAESEKNLTLLGIIKNNDFNKVENLLKDILGTNEYIRLTNNADWGADATTIVITGNTSIENTTGNTEILTAKFNDDSSTPFNWVITTGNDIIAFVGSHAGSSATYTPLKAGNATITVSSGTVTKNIVITVYDVVTPDLPINDPEKNPDGSTSITSSSGSIDIDSTNPKNATITDTKSNTKMIVTFEDDLTTGTPSSVTGTITLVRVVYNETHAVPRPDDEDTPDVVKYQLTLILNNATKDIPTINPEYNESVAGKVPQGCTIIAMINASANDLAAINNNISRIELVFLVPADWVQNMGDAAALEARLKGYHIKNGVVTGAPIPVTIKPDTDPNFYQAILVSYYGFSSYGLGVSDSAPPGPPGPGPGPQPQPLSSGDGNMNNAFRVLFDTNGGSFISPVTYLSYGDTISQPPAPAKDGYTFGGWYKDEACTIRWSFADSISGDMTLYAKWTAAAVGQSAAAAPAAAAAAATSPASAPTAAPQASAAAGGVAAAAPAATGVSPTLTQAPAPIAGLLLGILGAGILRRRRRE